MAARLHCTAVAPMMSNGCPVIMMDHKCHRLDVWPGSPENNPAWLNSPPNADTSTPAPPAPASTPTPAPAPAPASVPAPAPAPEPGEGDLAAPAEAAAAARASCSDAMMWRGGRATRRTWPSSGSRRPEAASAPALNSGALEAAHVGDASGVACCSGGSGLGPAHRAQPHGDSPGATRAGAASTRRPYQRATSCMAARRASAPTSKNAAPMMGAAAVSSAAHGTRLSNTTDFCKPAATNPA